MDLVVLLAHDDDLAHLVAFVGNGNASAGREGGGVGGLFGAALLALEDLRVLDVEGLLVGLVLDGDLGAIHLGHLALEIFGDGDADADREDADDGKQFPNHAATPLGIGNTIFGKPDPLSSANPQPSATWSRCKAM